MQVSKMVNYVFSNVIFNSFCFLYSVQCPNIDAIVNGILTKQTDGSLTTITYACLAGYYLDGNSNRECTDGKWSGSQPTCSKHQFVQACSALGLIYQRLTGVL